jgi:superfamily II DNA or RNA helicase
MELRQYQIDGIHNLRETLRAGVNRIMLQSPTGSGKTAISSEIFRLAREKNKRVSFVVPAISLVDQTVEKFYAGGIRDMGVIQANHPMTDYSQPVQICSIQTIAARGTYPQSDLVIIDEGHEFHEAHKRWIMDPVWANVPFIALSATPWTRGLEKYFQTLLVLATTNELIEQKYLSPVRFFGARPPDLRRVKIVAGDYHEGQLGDVMQDGELVADVIKTWEKFWGRPKTLVFAVNRAHAEQIQERFTAAGHNFAYQDGDTPTKERKLIERQFHDGTIDGVVSIMTMTTGIDFDVRCISLCRPTKSEKVLVQIGGRGTRLGDGKEHLVFIDHTETTETLGYFTDIHHDHLNDGKPKEKVAVKPKEALPRKCKSCDYLIPPKTPKCPNCGDVAKRESSIVERPGELMELTSSSKFKKGKKKHEMTIFDREIFFRELLGIAEEKSYKPGWASMKYKDRFGTWPPNGWAKVPAIPTYTTRSWVQAMNIRWHKGRAKHKGARI